jgi:hypothetical protein
MNDGTCEYYKEKVMPIDDVNIHIRNIENGEVTPPPEDMVNSPKHYNEYPLEVIELIRLLLDQPECDDLTAYQAYCLGNEIKYRLRAGLKNKDKIREDIEKSLWYMQRRQGVVNVTV